MPRQTDIGFSGHEQFLPFVSGAPFTLASVFDGGTARDQTATSRLLVQCLSIEPPCLTDKH